MSIKSLFAFFYFLITSIVCCRCGYFAMHFNSLRDKYLQSLLLIPFLVSEFWPGQESADGQTCGRTNTFNFPCIKIHSYLESICINYRNDGKQNEKVRIRIRISTTQPSQNTSLINRLIFYYLRLFMFSMSP